MSEAISPPEPTASLSEAEARILAAIQDADEAWCGPDALAASLGWESDATWDLLASLDVAGWIAVWEREDGPVVTLSPLAARRLGVRLREYGRKPAYRWVSEQAPEPRGPRAASAEGDTGPDPAWRTAVDPEPGPEVLLAQREAQSRKAAGPRRVRPALLLGLDLVPWPGPRVQDGTSCPACGSQHLPEHGYCLFCDRSGDDPGDLRLFATAATAARSAASPPERSRDLSRFLHARRDRKQKRKARAQRS